MSPAAVDSRLQLHAVFSVRGEDEESAYLAVAGLIDRLNEVANHPEHECDVHMSVERTGADGRRAHGSGT